MHSPSLAARQRLDGFDGLRGIVVLAVVLFHSGVLPFGWIGVDLFFCLSGFLITRILLEAKATFGTARSVLLPFYIRRALRIIPLATLVALITAAAVGAGWTTLWYITYMVNWMPSPPPPRELGHYWTLAVEEQFYILWPLVILLTSFSTSLRLAAALFVLCSIARALLISYPFTFATSHFLGNATIARADPLLIGAALALMTRNGIPVARKFRRAAVGALLGGFAGASCLEILGGFRWHSWAPKVAYTLTEPFLAVAFGGVLFLVLVNPPRWLQAAWLQSVGRMSYGVYVIHGCISPWLRANVEEPVTRTALLLNLSLLLASISWHYFESPVLRLKRRWPMPAAAPH